MKQMNTGIAKQHLVAFPVLHRIHKRVVHQFQTWRFSVLDPKQIKASRLLKVIIKKRDLNEARIRS